ncbi:MAG TPA: MFS transporter, partial [Blastocatellia bacterium]
MSQAVLSETAAGQKMNPQQVQVAATGFLSLFSLVGLSFYGLPFFYDFMVTEFGWSRTTVTS